jgi:hypothetical protein
LKIHKTTLQILSKQLLRLPHKAKILSAQAQNNTISLWYLFDDSAPHHIPEDTFDIRLAMTGNELPDDLGKYISTVQLHSDFKGVFVAHIFDATKYDE